MKFGSTANIEKEILTFVEANPQGVTYEEIQKGVRNGKRRVKNNPTTLVFHNAIKLEERKYYPN